MDAILSLDSVLENRVECRLEDYEAKVADDRLKLAKWTAWASGESVATTTTTRKARMKPMPASEGDLRKELLKNASPGLRAFLNQNHCPECDGLLTMGDAHGEKLAVSYKYCSACEKFVEFQSEGLPEGKVLEFLEWLKGQIT
jgi:hypothetical protein